MPRHPGYEPGASADELQQAQEERRAVTGTEQARALKALWAASVLADGYGKTATAQEFREAHDDLQAALSAAEAELRQYREQNEAQKRELYRLEAELRELREALREIAVGEPPADLWDAGPAVTDGVEWAGKIARAALARAGEAE